MSIFSLIVVIGKQNVMQTRTLQQEMAFNNNEQIGKRKESSKQ